MLRETPTMPVADARNTVLLGQRGRLGARPAREAQAHADNV